MASRSISLSGALAPVAALLMGTALLYLGYGLQAVLVPLRADMEGFSRIVVGLLGSTYYAGFVAGCLFAPYLILRSGHIRAFAAMVSCLSAAALAFPLLLGEAEWLLFRFAIGFCFSGLLVIVESWLNERATNATRGIVMSAYVVITYVCISVGQLGVAVQPVMGFTLFALCSIVLSLAAVPVALTRANQPAPIPVVRFRPWRLFPVAPAAFAGVFVNGLMAGSLFSLGAIYAIDIGFSKEEAAMFVSAAVLGGAIGQYPFGRVSDFVDRRLVLLVAVVATAAVSLVLAMTPDVPQSLVLALGLAAGLVMLPSYSLAAAHAFDWTEPDGMVETSASLILLFGVGSTIGPLLASLAMEWVGPGGLFLVVGVSAGALAGFIAVRIGARARPAEEMRSDFDIFSTAPVGGAITPEPISESDPLVEMPQVYAAPAEPPAQEQEEPAGAAARGGEEPPARPALPATEPPLHDARERDDIPA